MHKRYLTLALCCGAVALAGCGSSASSNSGTGAATGPSNPHVFSADLNALCKQASVAAKKVSSSPTKFLAVIQGYLPKFQALTASGSQQATYSTFVANIQKEATDLKAQNLKGAQAASAANNALATKLNAPACGASS